MTRTGSKLAIAVALTFGVALFLVACDQGSTSTQTETVTTTQLDAAVAGPTPPPQCRPPMPPPCASDTDCASGCPSGMGCTCRALPNDGPSVCMVKCAAATDCKAPPDAPPGAPAAACQDGVCAPPPPPMCPPPLPPPCGADADCANRCPPGATGCTCRALPNNGPSVCLMTCAAASDCPRGPGMPPLGCQDGVCVPPPPPEGAPPMGPPPAPPTE
jgi:hypothetical protein